MKTIRQLTEEKARAYDTMKDLVTRAKNENRDMTPDEHEQWNKADQDFEKLDEQISIQERMKAADAQMEQRQAEKREVKPVEYKDAFYKWAARGMGSLSPEERQAMIEQRGTNTQLSGTDNLGGYTVPTQFSNELEVTMEAFGGMLNVSRIITTSGGGTLEWPTLDDTATDSAVTTEGAAVTVQDMTFAQKTLGDFNIATQVKLSVQLVQDERVGLQGLLPELLGERHGRKLNALFTTGAGTTEPTGFVTDATTGENAAATAITRENILDLLHSIDPAYRVGPNVAFMFNDSTLAYIKKLSIGSGDDRPLWVPNMAQNAPATLEGYRYVINQDMAAIGTGNKSMAFGDWSKYVIRRVGGDVLVRLDERYMDELEIGFILYGRYDGKLIQTAAIKVLEHA
jgi:HK97 family phage major capsid protein